MSMESSGPMCKIDISESGGETLLAALSGNWLLKNAIPPSDTILQKLNRNSNLRHVRFEGSEIEKWDSALLLFLTNIKKECMADHIRVEYAHLPKGVMRLIELSSVSTDQKKTSVISGH